MWNFHSCRVKTTKSVYVLCSKLFKVDIHLSTSDHIEAAKNGVGGHCNKWQSKTTVKYCNQMMSETRVFIFFCCRDFFYWKIPLKPLPLRKENRELLPAASGRLLLLPSLLALDDELLDCPFLLWWITPGERKRRERSATRWRKQKHGDKLVIFIVCGCRDCVVKSCL